mmetsp:Transcript_5507/g.8132  ORF Transcript_5507/g.8132 Transcript_5507/m.8132 type:complete len:233 (-) Transcript_5507:414-1112(-)
MRVAKAVCRCTSSSSSFFLYACMSRMSSSASFRRTPSTAFLSSWLWSHMPCSRSFSSCRARFAASCSACSCVAASASSRTSRSILAAAARDRCASFARICSSRAARTWRAALPARAFFSASARSHASSSAAWNFSQYSDSARSAPAPAAALRATCESSSALNSALRASTFWYSARICSSVCTIAYASSSVQSSASATKAFWLWETARPRAAPVLEGARLPREADRFITLFSV